MNLNKSIKEFKSVIPSINQKYRPYAEQVINLFKGRKIEKRIEAAIKQRKRPTECHLKNH